MTLAEMATRPLKEALLKEYKHFSDKRIKKLSSGSSFIVDGRVPQDHGADGNLYSWFCLIFADVVDAQTVTVTLRGGVPQGTAVSNWVRQHGATADELSGMIFNLTAADVSKLTELAEAVRSIVRQGYLVRAYKHVCPRVASSLDRLHDVLHNHWRSGRPPADSSQTQNELPLSSG
jgi:hypothetical protein